MFAVLLAVGSESRRVGLSGVNDSQFGQVESQRALARHASSTIPSSTR